MTRRLRCPGSLMMPSVLLSWLLTACGGGVTPPSLGSGPTAPVPSGDAALDGFNWINYRRAMTGLPTLARNTKVDFAAQGHSKYQRFNNTMTHEQESGLPGYTGVTLYDRLTNAGYPMVAPYAIGEAITATSNPSGFYQAEEMINAIYHRFVLLEPIFKEMGTGTAANSSSYQYLTVDLTAVGGLGAGLGAGRVVPYPAANQTGVPLCFFSDSESPDPVPNQNEVGYPISVHADTFRAGVGITVQSFTVARRGGQLLSVRLLSHANDSNTGEASAAIIPLAPLKSATTYDVHFSGLVAGQTVTLDWSFTTR